MLVQQIRIAHQFIDSPKVPMSLLGTAPCRILGLSRLEGDKEQVEKHDTECCNVHVTFAARSEKNSFVVLLWIYHVNHNIQWGNFCLVIWGSGTNGKMFEGIVTVVPQGITSANCQKITPLNVVIYSHGRAWEHPVYETGQQADPVHPGQTFLGEPRTRGHSGPWVRRD